MQLLAGRCRYVLLGRHDDARRLFERLLGLRNDLGLLSEEYDSFAGRLVGNFPQAFSHLALVNSACNLSRINKPADQRGPTASGVRTRKPRRRKCRRLAKTGALSTCPIGGLPRKMSTAERGGALAASSQSAPHPVVTASTGTRQITRGGPRSRPGNDPPGTGLDTPDPSKRTRGVDLERSPDESPSPFGRR